MIKNQGNLQIEVRELASKTVTSQGWKLSGYSSKDVVTSNYLLSLFLIL